MIDYVAILAKRYPNAEWTLNGDNYNGLTWLSEGNPPTQAELDAAWPDVLAEMRAEKLAKETLKQNVLAKLGLTADEITALFS